MGKASSMRRQNAGTQTDKFPVEQAGQTAEQGAFEDLSARTRVSEWDQALALGGLAEQDPAVDQGLDLGPADPQEAEALSPPGPGGLQTLQTRAAQAQALRKAAAAILSDPSLRRENLAELYARRYAKDAVDIVWEIARDVALDPNVRRNAAMDLVAIAYGRPAAVVRTGPQEDSGRGTIIDGDIERAQAAATALAQLEEYSAIPPDQWPQALRAAAGLDMGGQTSSQDSAEGEGDSAED